jgi:hypothetical protein
MRMILLASMMTMAAAAHAETSIDVIKTGDAPRSVDYIRCTACAPLKSKKKTVTEVMLKPGTQKVEIRQVNGELKVFRTEAWLGGSPVTYVSKASTDLMDKQSIASATGGNVRPIAGESTAATTLKTVAVDDKIVAAKDKAAVIEDKPLPPATDADRGAKAQVTLNKHAVPTMSADMSNTDSKVTIDNNTTSSTNADTSGDTPSAAAPKMAQHFNPQDLQLRLK